MTQPPPARSDPHLAAALEAAAARIPVERVDQVWIFPPRSHGARESGLAVLALRAGEPSDPRRTLFTVRYETEAVKAGIRRTDVVQEEGTVPRDRLDRLVDGVVRRLGGGMETPEVRELSGDPAAWATLLQAMRS